MSARPGDLVAGGGFVGEAVQFGDGKVGIALFADRPGEQRGIEFVPSAEVQVLRLAQDWNGGSEVAGRQRELGKLFSQLSREPDYSISPTW